MEEGGAKAEEGAEICFNRAEGLNQEQLDQDSEASWVQIQTRDHY